MDSKALLSMGRTAMKSSPEGVSGVIGADPADRCCSSGSGRKRKALCLSLRCVLLPLALQRPLLARPVSGSD